jgi:hypothetical protein
VILYAPDRGDILHGTCMKVSSPTSVRLTISFFLAPVLRNQCLHMMSNGRGSGYMHRNEQATIVEPR